MALYTAEMAAHAAAVEAYWPHCVPVYGDGRDRLAEAMRYALAGGGKRLRPVLLLEWCRVCGGDGAAALPFAAAVEMIHAYSLAHDDLPCMDNSPTRRGKPSAHAAFGEAAALLAGDALLTRAFEVMLRAEDVPAARALRAASELADGAGVGGMCGGQMLDLLGEGAWLTAAELEGLQSGKTAALIAAACVMGAILAGAEEHVQAAARAFGTALGLCFQAVDDLLDATGDADALGKPVGADAAAEKSTWVSLLGTAGAAALADSWTAQAVGALLPLGGEGAGLAALAEALRKRER